MIVKPCVDCRTLAKKYNSTRCSACFKSNNPHKRENNPNWNGGGIKVYCMDCEKQLGRSAYFFKAKRCYKCEGIRKSGKNSKWWKGGVTPLHNEIRGLRKYRIWVREVFKRDNYTCNLCGERGGKLTAHHLLRFSKILHEDNIKTIEDAINNEWFWNVDIGTTLCHKCHPLVHKIDRVFGKK